MPESRMLLMAGLLLADRTAGLEDKVREAEARAVQLQARIDSAQSVAPTVERVEVAVMPEGLVDTMSELAARAEALAEDVERRAETLTGA